MAGIKAIVVRGRVGAIVVGRPGPQGVSGVDGSDGRDGVDGAPGAPGAPGQDANAYPDVSQAEAEAGTEVANRSWSPLRVFQAAAKRISDHLAAYAHGDIAHANRAALNLVSGTNTGDQTLSGLGGLGKLLSITNRPTSYSIDDTIDSGAAQNATAAITITLPDYTTVTSGKQFPVIATGGIVTFSGVFASRSSYTKIAQGDVGVIVRKGTGWHVAGVSS